MKHVVMFSGGIGGWATAKRVAVAHGTADMVLLFADTLVEDPDLYRFLDQTSANIGVPITRIADGRTPWQVFRDERMIGNSRIDPCSRILKREQCDKWLAANCDQDNTTVYVGIDWSEAHRFDDGEGRGVKGRLGANGWRVEAPLCDPPYLLKVAMLDELAREGIDMPRMYTLGFPHHNCGGFCIKAGQAHFELLLRELPEVYAKNENEEREWQTAIGKSNTVLRDRRGGRTRTLSLTSFRRRIETGGAYDENAWGGCGCFSGAFA